MRRRWTKVIHFGDASIICGRKKKLINNSLEELKLIPCLSVGYSDLFVLSKWSVSLMLARVNSSQCLAVTKSTTLWIVLKFNHSMLLFILSLLLHCHFLLDITFNEVDNFFTRFYFGTIRWNKQT